MRWASKSVPWRHSSSKHQLVSNCPGIHRVLEIEQEQQSGDYSRAMLSVRLIDKDRVQAVQGKFKLGAANRTSACLGRNSCEHASRFNSV